MKTTRLLAISAILTAFQVLGIPITYTFDGFGTGSLGPSDFTDAPFTITVQSDTNLITNPFGPRFPFIFATGPAPTTIEVQGIGTASFLSGLSVYVHQIRREVG